MAVKARRETLVGPRPHRHSKARRKVTVKERLRRPAWDGIARIFDFTGSLNPPARPLPPNIVDQHAIGMDWKAVGNDLVAAIGNVVPERDSDRRQGSDAEVV
jgi:hypothetical protein